jgi:hypothetical protein
MNRILFCILSVLVLSSAAFAWAINQPTPPADNIYVRPGTSSSVCESAQNMVGGQDVVLQLEILQGSDIASFSNGKLSMQLLVPFGELDVKWCMNLKLPVSNFGNNVSENVKSPKTNEDVIIKASKRTETQGVVTFSTAQLATLHVIPSEVPVEVPVEAPQIVVNGTAQLEARDAVVPVALQVVGTDKVWLYILLGIVAVVVVVGIYMAMMRVGGDI